MREILELSKEQFEPLRPHIEVGGYDDDLSSRIEVYEPVSTEAASTGLEVHEMDPGDHRAGR